ncbi:MAG: hypothetical protein M5R37_02120 [Melioribacteraceae bacterium]|nr:hypothetical protein [Melioribacteraceae bacterium]
MAKGIIIKESLKDNIIPYEDAIGIQLEYEHLLGGTEKVHVIRTETPNDILDQVIGELSKAIRSYGFYCHFVDDPFIHVVFHNCVYTIEKGNKDTFVKCREIGKIFGIPEEQMKFEKMFEKDHPNE